MTDALSRVSSKFQTVIPKAVRERLALEAGDVLRFRMDEDGVVTINRVESAEDDTFASFGEWSSREDDRLYRDL